MPSNPWDEFEQEFQGTMESQQATAVATAPIQDEFEQEFQSVMQGQQRRQSAVSKAIEESPANALKGEIPANNDEIPTAVEETRYGPPNPLNPWAAIRYAAGVDQGKPYQATTFKYKDTIKLNDQERMQAGLEYWRRRESQPQDIGSATLDRLGKAGEYIIKRSPLGAGTGWSMAAAKNVTDALHRMDAGKATEDDYLWVGKFAHDMEKQQEAAAKKGIGPMVGRAADTASYMPGFVADFVLSAGVTAGVGKGASSLAAQALKRVVSKETLKATGKYAVGRGAIALASQVPGQVAQGLAMATIAAPTAIGAGKSFMERRIPDFEFDENGKLSAESKEHVVTSAWKGFADNATETISEQLGGSLMRPIAGALKPVTGAAKKLAGAAAVNFVPKGVQTAIRKQYERAVAAKLLAPMKAIGYHGIPAEGMEERAGEVIRWALGVNEDAGITGDVLAGRFAEASHDAAVETMSFAAFPIIQTGIRAMSPAIRESWGKALADMGDNPSRRQFQQAGLPEMEAKARTQYVTSMARWLDTIPEAPPIQTASPTSTPPAGSPTPAAGSEPTGQKPDFQESAPTTQGIQHPETSQNIPEHTETSTSPAPGSYVQWTVNGADQFATPKRVASISPDGKFVLLEGEKTGVPVEQVSVVGQPNVVTPDRNAAMRRGFEDEFGPPTSPGSPVAAPAVETAPEPPQPVEAQQRATEKPAGPSLSAALEAYDGIRDLPNRDRRVKVASDGLANATLATLKSTFPDATVTGEWGSNDSFYAKIERGGESVQVRVSGHSNRGVSGSAVAGSIVVGDSQNEIDKQIGYAVEELNAKAPTVISPVATPQQAAGEAGGGVTPAVEPEKRPYTEEELRTHAPPSLSHIARGLGIKTAGLGPKGLIKRILDKQAGPKITLTPETPGPDSGRLGTVAPNDLPKLQAAITARNDADAKEQGVDFGEPTPPPALTRKGVKEASDETLRARLPHSETFERKEIEAELGRRDKPRKALRPEIVYLRSRPGFENAKIVSKKALPAPELRRAHALLDVFGVPHTFIEGSLSFTNPTTRHAYIGAEHKRTADLYRHVGDEMAHSLGLDIDSKAFTDEQIAYALQEYLSAWGDKYPGKQDDSRLRREAVSHLVGKMLMDEKFLNQLERDEPNLFQKIIDAILQVLGMKKGLTPEQQSLLKEFRDKRTAHNERVAKAANEKQAEIERRKIELPTDAPPKTAKPATKEEWAKKAMDDLDLGSLFAGQDAPYFAAAYHGSPHSFDKFTTAKMGTGEGNQSYGWGMYFAGKKEVAEHYKNVLSRHAGTEGRGYQVDLKPAEDEYLLWDKPLNEQSPKVRKALEDSGLAKLNYKIDEEFLKKNGSSRDWWISQRTYLDSQTQRTGGEFYKELANNRERTPGAWRDAEYTSKELRAAGIRGIKYADQGSRMHGKYDVRWTADGKRAEVVEKATGKAVKDFDDLRSADRWVEAQEDPNSSFNYVIFDDADVEIQAYFAAPDEAPKQTVVERLSRAVSIAVRAGTTKFDDFLKQVIESAKKDTPSLREAAGDAWNSMRDSTGNHAMDVAIASLADVVDMAELAKSLKKERGLTIAERDGKWEITNRVSSTKKFNENNAAIRKVISQLGSKEGRSRGGFNRETKVWEIDSDPTHDLGTAFELVSQQSGVSGNRAGDMGGGWRGRGRFDVADRRRDSRDYANLVEPETQALIRSAPNHIPPEVLDNQIVDIGMALDAFDSDMPLFMVANDVGTGKTFVLGGIIRELRNRGENKFVYVTNNSDLVDQIKSDLIAYNIGDIDFVSYSKSREGLTDAKGAVLIFDEAHKAKNKNSAQGAAAGVMMKQAKFTIMASATPFENPTQAEYLAPTGVFDGLETVARIEKKKGVEEVILKGFPAWAWTYGATVHGEGENIGVSWPGGRDVRFRQILARDWFLRQGLFTQREITFTKGLVESNMYKVESPQEFVDLYRRANDAYARAEMIDDRSIPEIRRHKAMYLKRLLESSKIPNIIARAKEYITAGNQVAVFTETKSDRILGKFRKSNDTKGPHYAYPAIQQMMDDWEAGGRQESPPFSRGIVALAQACYEMDFMHTMPSVVDELKKAFAENRISEYHGGQAARNKRHLAAWKNDKTDLLIITMAKGGTGLSLHDTTGKFRPRVQIVANLPWTATQIKQVGGRIARYGVAKKVIIEWLFSGNLGTERRFANRIGSRMQDMGALVNGIERHESGETVEEFAMPETAQDVVNEMGDSYEPPESDFIPDSMMGHYKEMLKTGAKVLNEHLEIENSAIDTAWMQLVGMDLGAKRKILDYWRNGGDADGVKGFDNAVVEVAHTAPWLGTEQALMEALINGKHKLLTTKSEEVIRFALQNTPTSEKRKDVFEEHAPEADDDFFAAPDEQWRSNALDAMESFTQAKGSQQQILAHLQKHSGAMDEAKWIGLDDYLKRGKATYTKQEVQDFVREHRVEVKEVELGSPNWSEPEEEYDPIRQYHFFIVRDRDTNRVIGEGNTPDAARADARAETQGNADQTHFQQYSLAGGENYRERFVTLPAVSKSPITLFKDKMEEKYGEDRRHDFEILTPEEKEQFKAATEAANEATKSWNDGHSQYSSIQNPVVRLRTNERTTADGKRVLFLEEMQPPSKENQAKMPEWAIKRWREIGMKQALRLAAEQGLDGIAWTTGSQQAERYSLEKQVESIEYTAPENTTHGEGQLKVFGKFDNANENQVPILDKRVPPGNLAEYIGKEAAKKILDSTPDRYGIQAIEGDDLKIGGEGLKQAYDRDLPNVANKLAKKFGGKVGETKVSLYEKLDSDQPFYDVEKAVTAFGNGWTVHGVDFHGDDVVIQTEEEIRSIPWREFYLNQGKSKGQSHKREPLVDVNFLSIPPSLREHASQGMPLFAAPTTRDKIAAALAGDFFRAIDYGSAREAALNWAKKMFVPGGNAPAVVSKGELTRNHRVDAAVHDGRFAVRSFDKAVRSTYGTDFDNIDKSQQDFIRKALVGSAPLAVLPSVKLQQAVGLMRTTIDSLSVALVAANALGVQAGLSAQQGMGKYMNRAYRIFDDPLWYKKVPARIRSRAVQEVIAQNPAATKQQAENYVAALLFNDKAADRASNVRNVIRAANRVSKDLSITLRKKDVPAWLRRLFGEYDDPRVNFMRTIAKQAHLLETHKLLTEIASQGLGTFLFDPRHPHPNHTAEFMAEIAAPDSTALSPLNGLHTTPEIKQALEKAFGNDAQLPAWARGLLALNMAAKFSKTALSNVTQVRNFLGNPIFLIAQGWAGIHTPFIKTRRDAVLKGFTDAFRTIATDSVFDPGSQAMRDYSTRLVRLGVTQTALGAGELRATLNDMQGTGLLDWLGIVTDEKKMPLTVGAMKIGKAGFGVAKFLYTKGDDFWRVLAFEIERSRWKDAMPGATDEWLDDRAASRVRDGMQTYEELPEAIKKFRVTPIGPFVMFPADTVRIAAKTFRNIAEELRDANPKVRAIGAARLAGVLQVAALPSVMVALSMLAFGVPPDEDKAMRRSVAPWDRNAQFLHLGKNPDGTLRVVNISYLDAFSNLRKPLLALFNGGDVGTRLQEAGKEMAQPFLNEQLVTGKMMDVRSNVSYTGNTPRSVHAPYGYQAGTNEAMKAAADDLWHVWTGLEPGVVTYGRELLSGGQGRTTESGRKFDAGLTVLKGFTGTKPQDIDFKQSLSFRAQGFSRNMQEATRRMNSKATNPGNVPMEEIEKAYHSTESARRAMFDEMHESIADAMKLGMSVKEVGAVLKDAGMSEANRENLIAGAYEPFVPSDQSEELIFSRPEGAKRLERIRELAVQTSRNPNKTQQVLAAEREGDTKSHAEKAARTYPLAVSKEEKSKGITLATKRAKWRSDVEAAANWLTAHGIAPDQAVKSYKGSPEAKARIRQRMAGRFPGS